MKSYGKSFQTKASVKQYEAYYKENYAMEEG